MFQNYFLFVLREVGWMKRSQVIILLAVAKVLSQFEPLVSGTWSRTVYWYSAVFRWGYDRTVHCQTYV